MSTEPTAAQAFSAFEVEVGRRVALERAGFARDSETTEWSENRAKEDSADSVQAFLSFYRIHGLAVEEGPHIPRLRQWWSQLWMAGWFIPLAKYAFAYPLAAMSGVEVAGEVLFRELPPPPAFLPDDQVHPLRYLVPEPLLLRPLRTRLTERAPTGQPSKRALDLAWSLLGLKDAMPAMWVTKVAENLQDHANLLSSTPPPLSDLARDVLRLVGLSVARGSGLHLASTSRKRPMGLLRELPRPKLSSSAGWVKFYDAEEKRWRTMSGTRAAQYQRLETTHPGLDDPPLQGMHWTPHAGVAEFRGHPYDFHWNDWDFTSRVSVVALQEPFKIRTISIADGPATAAGTPIQKALHGFLRDLHPFHLIGGKKVSHVTDSMFSFDGNPDEGFVSGDFSAATDRLSMHATTEMFSALLNPHPMDPELRRRLLVGLTAAELDYSKTLDPYKKKVPRGLLRSIELPPLTRQTNGQLMGNVLSFPFLCLINLSAYLLAHCRYSLETGDLTPVARIVADGLKRGHLTTVELDSLPVLINGDDILFRATPALYTVWRETIAEFGLKLSVGKNYFSKRFFTVNSELYTADGRVTRPWWGALLTDTVRMRNELKYELGEDVLSGDMRRILPGIQSIWLGSVPVARRALANDLWFERYKDSLAPYKGLNWFLPVELGGMGLDPVDRKVEYTYAQRKLAAKAILAAGELPRGLGPQGSLLNEENERKLRRGLNSALMKGELVTTSDGRKFVIDERDAGKMDLTNRSVFVPRNVVFRPPEDEEEEPQDTDEDAESSWGQESHWNDEAPESEDAPVEESTEQPSSCPSCMDEEEARLIGTGPPYVPSWMQKEAPEPKPWKGLTTIRAHELVSSYVQRSNLFDRWLDHHTDGVRLEAEVVKEKVTKMLTWGLRLSDKHLQEMENLDYDRRYQCLRATTILGVRRT